MALARVARLSSVTWPWVAWNCFCRFWISLYRFLSSVCRGAHRCCKASSSFLPSLVERMASWTFKMAILGATAGAAFAGVPPPWAIATAENSVTSARLRNRIRMFDLPGIDRLLQFLTTSLASTPLQSIAFMKRILAEGDDPRIIGFEVLTVKHWNKAFSKLL